MAATIAKGQSSPVVAVTPRLGSEPKASASSAPHFNNEGSRGDDISASNAFQRSGCDSM
jgi:hypothetical protein